MGILPEMKNRPITVASFPVIVCSHLHDNTGNMPCQEQSQTILYKYVQLRIPQPEVAMYKSRRRTVSILLGFITLPIAIRSTKLLSELFYGINQFIHGIGFPTSTKTAFLLFFDDNVDFFLAALNLIIAWIILDIATEDSRRHDEYRIEAQYKRHPLRNRSYGGRF